MRIRYVAMSAFGMGGTTRSVINQANALCADHDVEIASMYRPRRTPRLAIDARVRLVPLTAGGEPRTPPSRLSRLANQALRFPNPLPHRHDPPFRRWRPAAEFRLMRYFWAADDGILVTTRPGLNLLAARTAPRRLIRVAQDHMNLASYRPALRHAIVQAYRRLDALVVLTEQDLAAYQRALEGAATRVECIPNGVPAPRLAPSALNAKVLIAAGRLEPQKGFDLLLDAFHTVAAKHPDWQLWIFGAGTQRDQLATQIEDLHLIGRAHLKGLVDRFDEQLAAASMFVLSSRFEGLPMVILEAITAGLPVVAFDCPTGPAEVITHGQSGLLVPAQDVPGLAAAICQLIEDPTKRHAMGATALEESKRFSSGAVAQRWETLFSTLIAARSRDLTG
jgi:glycosyltransferase involved in cell wall biosynthesis